MGLLGTRWEAEYEGHRLAVNRNEVGRGFAIEWDGREIVRKSWSLLGLGRLQGSVEVDGKPVEIAIAIGWAGFSDLDGKCTMTVGGTEVPVRKVR